MGQTEQLEKVNQELIQARTSLYSSSDQILTTQQAFIDKAVRQLLTTQKAFINSDGTCLIASGHKADNIICETING